jgi:archaellum component FlaF (FlaF/FlaG flagellin family)
MKKFNYKTIFLLLVTISSIYLVNIQINISIENSNLTITTEDELSTSTGPVNLAAWIIIAGDRSDHDKLNIIRSGCDQAYEALLNRGFTGSQICYLDPSYGTHSTYRDYDTTLSTIQWAIETWAPTKGVDATHGLGIYMFDHGGTGYMCIPGTDLSDSNLNTYLDNLESSTGCNRIILVYEACHAGSFINPVSKNNRIVVTATDSAHGSYVNPAGDWATFSDGFWGSIIQCNTIGEAFEDGEAYVEAVGDGGIQYPWIDDNHDEVGHEVDAWGNIPNGGDGSDALNYWIGTGTNCPLILITWLPLKYYIKWPGIFIPISAVIQSTETLKKVYARLIPPNFTPPEIETDDEGSKLGQYSLPLIELQDQGDDNYSGAFYYRNFPNFLGSLGDYKINIIAKGQSGAMADVETTYVTLNDDGQTPSDTTPPTVSITSPSTNTNVSDVITITAEGDDDQALDKIQIFLDGLLLKEESMPLYYPYPEVTHTFNTTKYANGDHTITAKAIDKANNTKSDSIILNFQNELVSTIPGFHITTLFIGSLLGLIMTYFIYVRKNRNRRNK